MVTIEHNHALVELPAKEEVKQVVSGLNGQSVGGSDGLTRSFFHACWEIIGDDVFAMEKDFFLGMDCQGSYHTQIWYYCLSKRKLQPFRLHVIQFE